MIALRFARTALALALGLLVNLEASAAPSPVKSTQAVTSSVANSCVLNSADTLSFGSYDPTSAAGNQASGSLKLHCTKGAVVSVSTTSGGAILHGSGGNLSYALYTDSGLSKKWGATSYNYVSVSPQSSSTNLFFANQISITTWATCVSLAQSTGFATMFNNSPTGPNGACSYNTAPPVSGGYLYQGTPKNFVYDSVTAKTLLTGTSSFPTYILPPGSTAAGGGTFNVPNGNNGQYNLGQTSTSALSPIQLTYYAKVPGSQDVTPGVYTDTVIISAAF